MGPAIRSIRDVAEKNLCCGCGACAYIEPKAIEMVDDLGQGRRPLVTEDYAEKTDWKEALAACPGIELDRSIDPNPAGLIEELLPEWGPILEVWEGYAADSEIRFAGSSGGAASALALYGIEAGGMHGALHIAARPDAPYLNQTVLSRSRAELLAATGSRYAPASPCDGLERIEKAPAPCIFIGKPCDVAAAQKARRLRPALDERLGVTVAFFCAGAPSTRGTLEMIRGLGIEDLDQVVGVRYRGNGWPGNAVVQIATENGIESRELSYEDSWGGILEKHRPWRCRVCADHTGEFGDIAVADPWYRTIQEGEAGSSLVLARTEVGRRFIQDASEAGYLVLERKPADIVTASQPNLLNGRGSVWGRVVACRMLGVAAPRYLGMHLFSNWWKRLTFMEKVRSLLGTARRVLFRGLHRRTPVQPHRTGEGNSHRGLLG